MRPTKSKGKKISEMELSADVFFQCVQIKLMVGGSKVAKVLRGRQVIWD